MAFPVSVICIYIANTYLQRRPNSESLQPACYVRVYDMYKLSKYGFVLYKSVFMVLFDYVHYIEKLVINVYIIGF